MGSLVFVILWSILFCLFVGNFHNFFKGKHGAKLPGRWFLMPTPFLFWHVVLGELLNPLSLFSLLQNEDNNPVMLHQLEVGNN